MTNRDGNKLSFGFSSVFTIRSFNQCTVYGSKCQMNCHFFIYLVPHEVKKHHQSLVFLEVNFCQLLLTKVFVSSLITLFEVLVLFYLCDKRPNFYRDKVQV